MPPELTATNAHQRSSCGGSRTTSPGYFSEAVSEDWDAVAPPVSQSYLAHVAVRAIGKNVTPGYHVAKGEELGRFQFGGSTHCLVFRPGAIADFTLAALPQLQNPDAPLLLVRSKLATANTTAQAQALNAGSL